MRFLVPSLITAAALLHPLCAAEPGDTFTDPEKAGPDYLIQGEYVGEGCAAQVIALGDDEFRIIGYTPGLPGTAAEIEKKLDGKAKREGGKVVFNDQGWKGFIADGVIEGSNDEGQKWVLKRTVRESPTAGAKPPEGAVVLFDGKSAEQWKGGKVTPEGFLQAGVKSVPTFQSATIHVEFRTPFQPRARGQGRGNSGVYLQDRYEVQVLDSFGLQGENNECGGIYTVAKPRVNMAFPPLQWQTYDIDFEAAQFDAQGKKTRNAIVTVKHNGVLIHDKVEVPKVTTAAGRPEGPEPGPIQLQHHGNPVVFRNIWAVEKK